MSLSIVLTGCDGAAPMYDYSRAAGKDNRVQRPAVLVNVQVQIKKGLAMPELPTGPLTSPFVVRAKIVRGEIPKSPKAKEIQLRLYHGWTDVLVKDDAILNLNFTREGALFDINEFLVIGVGVTNTASTNQSAIDQKISVGTELQAVKRILSEEGFEHSWVEKEQAI